MGALARSTSTSRAIASTSALPPVVTRHADEMRRVDKRTTGAGKGVGLALPPGNLIGLYN